MKYVRKILAVLIVFIMLAALAIGIGVIYSVKNVNVTLLSYSYAIKDGDGEEVIAQKKAAAEEIIANCKRTVLGKYKGSIMSFVNGSAVAELTGGGDYMLVECEKVYPCTLNLTLKERRETFIASDGDRYRLYDETGKYLKTVKSDFWQEIINPIDGAPNIYVKGNVTDRDVVKVAKISRYFSENFGNLLRSIVASIDYISDKNQENAVFEMRSGLTVEIVDFTSDGELKIKKAAEVFASLSGESLLKGNILSYKRADGVYAYYQTKS